MEVKVTHIRSKDKFWKYVNPALIWKNKDLFVELFTRDIKMRYKQTAVGVLWAIFQPLLSMIIFTLVFGKLIKVPGGAIPYPVFVYIGLMFWNFFANSLTSASGSLVGNESLIKKVYFPRVIIPVSSIATNFFDLAITLLFFVVLLLFYGIVPSPYALFYFLFSILITLTTVTGAGLFLSALNVKYRDVRQVLPFFIQILIFVTPVFYPTSIVSIENQKILALNPLTTAIELSRKALASTFDVSPGNIVISLIISLGILFLGFYYFAKAERSFADNI